MGLQQYENAETAFMRGLEHDELDPNCLMGLCRTYVEWGKVNKALEYGKRAIGLKYRFPVAHHFYARALNRSGDADGAIRSLKTALKQNPNFQEAHEVLATIYDSVGEPELAIEHRGTARNLANDNKELIKEASGRIEFPPLEDLDFEQRLPKMPYEILAEVGILPRLSDPLQLETAESRMSQEEIIVVSGLPRSGTSMMMQMLAAAGLEIYTDDQRKPDENNPKGYFEADAVKGLAADNNWVKDCRGKVIKVIAPLVPFLPQDERYRVVFMQRDIKEILSSQDRMLGRLGEQGADIEKEGQQLQEAFLQQVLLANRIVMSHGNPLLPIPYASAIENPEKVARQVAEFLGMELDISAMVAAVDPSLHREKA